MGEIGNRNKGREREKEMEKDRGDWRKMERWRMEDARVEEKG